MVAAASLADVAAALPLLEVADDADECDDARDAEFFMPDEREAPERLIGIAMRGLGALVLVVETTMGWKALC